jgi:hypothetical protein
MVRLLFIPTAYCNHIRRFLMIISLTTRLILRLQVRPSPWGLKESSRPVSYVTVSTATAPRRPAYIQCVIASSLSMSQADELLR